MEKYNLITNSAVELGDDLTTEGNGKGRKFVSKFIEPGVASYEQFGDVLITKETLNKFINTMVGCPVIIKHKDITDKNADKERVGVVSDVWFNETDGWFYCSGIIWDKQAIDLVKNQGWNVSCTYDFESDKEAKTHNGKKIDMEFTDGNFLHLALVDNPRYERANIVMNSKVENEDQWITIKPNGEENKGRHLLIKEGETVQEAMERTYGIDGAKGQQKLFDTKGDRKTKEDFKRERDEKQKKYDELEKQQKEARTKEATEKAEKKNKLIQDYIDRKISPEELEKALPDLSFNEWHDIAEKRMNTPEQKQSDTKKDEKESYYEPDMEEHYTKAYEDSISKDFEEFMKSRKEEKKDTYYEPDMEETYTKSYEDAISKDYDEFMKAQKEKKEQPKEDKKEPESPFGDGVEIKEHDKKGYFLDSKNLKSYKKGDKFAILDDFSSDGRERYNVSFHDGKKRLGSKTYSTKRGMEKAIREHLQGGANKETKALAVKTDLNAAQTRYKDVLSKYNAADRKRWESGISSEEYNNAWRDYEKYKKELTGARREYAESIMSNFEAQEHTAYDDKIADKKMRYEEMAAKTEAESNRIAKQSREMLDVIPFGQPIHGQRDANYRQKIWDKMDKSYQLSKKADYYERKAGSVGTAGISSDDANAIAKLAQKYKSGVDSAEKRRIIDRVIDLHSRATSTKPASEQTDYGFSVERNKDLNRLQLKFDNIPDANTRAILKSNGFRWSPREKAWQRQLNGNSEYSLKSVMEKMKAENALLEGIEDILTEHNISNNDLPILSGLYDILKD